MPSTGNPPREALLPRPEEPPDVRPRTSPLLGCADRRRWYAEIPGAGSGAVRSARRPDDQATAKRPPSCRHLPRSALCQSPPCLGETRASGTACSAGAEHASIGEEALPSVRLTGPVRCLAFSIQADAVALDSKSAPACCARPSIPSDRTRETLRSMHGESRTAAPSMGLQLESEISSCDALDPACSSCS